MFWPTEEQLWARVGDTWYHGHDSQVSMVLTETQHGLENTRTGLLCTICIVYNINKHFIYALICTAVFLFTLCLKYSFSLTLLAVICLNEKHPKVQFLVWVHILVQ